MASNPFFILGSPRSGTTLLRDLLRQRGDLICPEETMYYRWASAFGSPEYRATATRNAVLRKHRELDGIGQEEFEAMFDQSASRRDLLDRHIALLREKRGAPDARWFDKSPHNVYGLPLLVADYPQAPIVHIHRHPVEVAASAVSGRQLGKHSLAAAINVWLEPMVILEQLRPLLGGRLIELPYRRLATEPAATLAELETRLGLPPFDYRTRHVRAERGAANYRAIFGAGEIAQVEARCGAFMQAYGYRPALADQDRDFAPAAADRS